MLDGGTAGAAPSAPITPRQRCAVKRAEE